MHPFLKAKAIWGADLKAKYNQFLGFHRQLQIHNSESILFKISARNYYRLYINGQMLAHGPARTATHHCRVDELSVSLSGTVNVAIEVAAFSTPERYCNDCTMEDGMLTCEISDSMQNILAFTGDKDWTYCELRYRDPLVETMSHSREIIEVYNLTPTSFQWQYGLGCMDIPVSLEEKITYLKRRSPYPSYQPISFQKLLHVSDIFETDTEETDSNYVLSRIINPKWYQYLPKEKCFLKTLFKEAEILFSGTYQTIRKTPNLPYTLHVSPAKRPVAFTWELAQSEVGFPDFSVTVSSETTIDILTSDVLEPNGFVKANTYVTRYHLQTGSYHLTAFEPKLTKYIKLIFRTKTSFSFTSPVLLDNTYPATEDCFFKCSDYDLNRIYDAAKRTLRLNTLDIFMDCPQRERAGWLCDSYYSSMGAWQLFGDLSVEKDFIENFMLTDADQMWHSFFPEVYPASKTDVSDPGLRSWSFWLLAELFDYYERSGDKSFIETCKERVSRFIEGMLSLRGESGLLENMGALFVDWSLSNREFCLEPISVPCNCLAVSTLEKMAILYHHPDWKAAADEMRNKIEAMDNNIGIFGGGGDSAQFKNGTLERGSCPTESGIALELWSGFHRENPNYIRDFVEKMGVAPLFPSNPNIGKSNLFIGLMIRFEVLTKLEKADALLRDLKALYLPELTIGTGTLFENVNDVSGCHGFNGAVGALLTNVILGLGQPKQLTKTIEIKPHLCGLKWATGTAKCTDGNISLHWSADYEEHIFEMTLQLPDDWKYELKLPFELNGWKVILNQQY